MFGTIFSCGLTHIKPLLTVYILDRRKMTQYSVFVFSVLLLVKHDINSTGGQMESCATKHTTNKENSKKGTDLTATQNREANLTCRAPVQPPRAQTSCDGSMLTTQPKSYSVLKCT